MQLVLRKDLLESTTAVSVTFSIKRHVTGSATHYIAGYLAGRLYFLSLIPAPPPVRSVGQLDR